MRRGTTPTIRLRVKGDFAEWSLRVSFQNGREVITKSGDDLDVSYAGGVTSIATALTQEDTLSFKAESDVHVQVRMISSDGAALATTIAKIPVKRILLEGVISYD